MEERQNLHQEMLSEHVGVQFNNEKVDSHQLTQESIDEAYEGFPRKSTTRENHFNKNVQSIQCIVYISKSIVILSY